MVKTRIAGPRGPTSLVRGKGHPVCCGWILSGFLGLLAVLASDGHVCVAQRPSPVQVEIPQAGSAFVPAERSVILLLDRTRALLAESRYAEAVQCLDRILAWNEDYFFKPDAESSVHRSIKSEARRLLGSIPASGRQSYELQFGALARSMLDKAVEAGDVAVVAEVARRFFHTDAGYEATFLLGLHHMDHGRPLVAALTLRRLRDESPISKRYEPALSLAMARSWLGAGMPEQARETLDTLHEDYQDRVVTIEGREVPLFRSSEDSIDWLVASLGPENAGPVAEPVNWAVHGGSPERNTVSKGTRPLLSAEWFVPATDHPAVEAMIDRLGRMQEERERPLLPGLYPLVVNDVVLMRTAANLLAVDCKTGKRLWEVGTDDPFEEALNPSPDGYVNPYNYRANIESGLRLRLWGDGVFGTLASDGQLVFAVQDLQLPTAAIYSRGLLVPGNLRSAGSLLTSNRLAAYDIQSQGKLRWEVGGLYSEKLPLAGAFFLGPPLPLLGDLYVLAEIGGEVRLLALDAENGTPLWQQQLAIVDQSVSQDTLRRVSGVSPSYADGILVCPTSHHSIVAIELTTRSLLWGYSYSDLGNADQGEITRLAAIRHQNANPEDRWTDSSLILADGCVLATPVDSDEIHCLSLHDGKLLWSAPRGDKQFIATVTNGKVVVATRKGLTALHLENGEPAWEPSLAPCPDRSEPSGRGFSDGELYYLPLTDAKLMSVRLETGQVEQVMRSRYGRDLGNLVCHNGRIFSQRADGVESYHQLDALRHEVEQRLADHPDDARALTLQGEILRDDGKLDAAVGCLRKSLDLKDSLRTRTLFREVMFEGLTKDFAHYHPFREEIETLLETPDDWSAFHRLVATGWEAAGEYDRALAEFRLLVDLDLKHHIDHSADLDARVDKGYSVRQHRWIRTHLLELAARAPAGARADLLQWSGELLQRNVVPGNPDSVGRLLLYFDGLPGTKEFKEEWIEGLIATGRFTEAELALMHEVRSSADTVRSLPLQQWTALLVGAKREEDASRLLAEIENRWADVPFGDNKAGRQWAAEFARQNDAILRSREPVRWPAGLVKSSVTETDQGSVVLSYSRGVVPFRSSQGLFYGDLVVEHYRQQEQLIVAKNGFGQIIWRFPLDSVAAPDELPTNQILTRVDACGHLLLLTLGNQIVALDTLVTKDDGTPTVAWRESSDYVDAPIMASHTFPAQMQNAQGWLGGSVFGGRPDYSPGNVVVLGESLVCVKRSRTCAVLDAATGATLWEREGISPQSTVFGDDKYVLIVPRQATEARVFRASDGRELEPHAVPPDEQRLMTIGRKILCWEPHERDFHLKLVDPLAAGEDGVLWGPLAFPRSSNPRQQLVDQDLLAVFSSLGKLQLIRLSDGKLLVDTQLEAERPLSDVVVFPRDGQFLVVANDNMSPRNPKRQVLQVTGLKARRIGKARIYSFDSQGTPLWKKPTIVEDHFLPLVQPRGAPCLTFACMVREAVPSQSRQTGVDILCVDTRSGAIVAREEFAQASHALEIVAAPNESKVEIRMQQETLTLEFTDDPVPEGGAATGAAVRIPDNPLEAIWQAILDGTTTREGKYHSRNSGPDGTKKRAAQPEAGDTSKPTPPAAGDKPGVSERAAPGGQKRVLPPLLEPAVRGEIVPR